MDSLKFAFGGAHQITSAYDAALLDAAGWLDAAQDPFMGWVQMPEQDLADVLDAAQWLRGFDAVVHVGIGGSALGNQMLHQAMFGDNYNQRLGHPEFYLADNPDPQKVRDIWQQVKDTRFALVGVSKSGSTAETTSQFLWFRDRLEEQNPGHSAECVMVVTDPQKGVFRPFALDTGCRALPIPPDVGGRFSVLSPAGLISSAALGGDIRALLGGALEMKHALTPSPDNPALRLGAIHLHHEAQGRSMSVMFPYSSRLEKFSEWYAQLWAESLGKGGRGTTPVRALGAVDQHSQVQLYVDGPDDKLFTFIRVGGEDIILPEVRDKALSELSYLSGRGLGEMLRCEAVSTAAALRKADRPVVWLEMDEVSPRSLGALIYFYQYLTALTGHAMGIDPFDQPGVEQGKRYTYGFMGRAGFEEYAAQARALFAEIEQ